MANRARYTTQQVIDALREAKGFKSVAAKNLDCHRETIDNYLKRHATIQTAYDEILEERHDIVESKIMKAIMEGNTAMIIFYAKCQMKARGYIEKSELEISTTDNKPLPIMIVSDEIDLDQL